VQQAINLAGDGMVRPIMERVHELQARFTAAGLGNTTPSTLEINLRDPAMVEE
jgi:hypothetical protein